MTVLSMGLTTLISFVVCRMHVSTTSKQARKQASKLSHENLCSIAGTHMHDVRKDSQKDAVITILGRSS